MLIAGFAVVEPGVCGVSFALGKGVVLEVVVVGVPEPVAPKEGGGSPGVGVCEFAIAPVVVPSNDS